MPIGATGLCHSVRFPSNKFNTVQAAEVRTMSVSSATSLRPSPVSRSEWILILGSSLTVIAILSIVTFLLIREHSSAQLSATRAASNIVQLIDADVLHNVELYDLSLQGLICASQRTDL